MDWDRNHHGIGMIIDKQVLENVVEVRRNGYMIFFVKLIKLILG